MQENLEIGFHPVNFPSVGRVSGFVAVAAASKMTLDQLDRLLGEWKLTVDAVAQNLVDLQSLPSYELLIGSVGSPKPNLTGATEQYITGAAKSIQDLLHQFGALSEFVARAESLRKQLPRFPGWERLPGSDQKVADIAAVLTSMPVPFARGSVTPSGLMTQMKARFDFAQSALLQIDRAWKQLDAKLADAAAFLNAHGSELATGNLRQRTDALRTRVIADPFGSNAEFDRDIQPELNRVRHAVETLVSQRANVQRNLERARGMLRQLTDIRIRAAESYMECRQKITGFAAATPPLPAERIKAIAGWLARLETRLAEGTVDPVCVGLENWAEKVHDLIEVETRACAENSSFLHLRRELRGRLSALRAKALARGVADDLRLSQAGERAHALLHARPTPLREASELVSQYEARLNGRG